MNDSLAELDNNVNNLRQTEDVLITITKCTLSARSPICRPTRALTVLIILDVTCDDKVFLCDT